MTTNPCAWPVCPRPQSDDFLPSWFERVNHKYAMSPLLLLGAIERADSGKAVTVGIPQADRLLDRGIADRVTVLGQLSASEIAALWPAATDWNLHNYGFSVYCPYCCLNDFTHGRTPYSRRIWQQSSSTIVSLR